MKIGKALTGVGEERYTYLLLIWAYLSDVEVILYWISNVNWAFMYAEQ